MVIPPSVLIFKPIEKIWTSYKDLFTAFRDATAGLPKGQQKAIFNDTAARVYRLD